MAGLLSYQLGPQLTGSQFLGDALSGLGSGLLAYGAGGPTRQQAGLIGLQALQQAPQRRNELAMSGLQQQALRQQIGQGAISNKIANMNAINRLNAINELNGDPRRYTEKDLEDNPDLLSQSSASPALMATGSGVPPTFQQPQSAPPSQSMTPQSTVMPTAPGNPYQPLSAGPSMPMPSQGQSQGAQPTGGVLQGQQPPQAGVLGGGQPSNGQQGYTQADYDAAARRAQLASYAIDPKTGQLVMSTATNDPRYLAMVAQQKALIDKNQMIDQNGNIVNRPGAVNAGAQVARANAYATSQAGLPADLTKIWQQSAANQSNDRAKAAITPTTITVPDGKGGFTQVNTNNLAASGGSAGLPVFTEMDKQMVPLLTANIGENQKGAIAARDSLTQLGELRKALTGLPTGPGTDITNEAAAALQKAGIDINQLLPQGYQTNPTQYAIASKNFNTLGMALARANFPGGRITNADLTLALKAVPNFINNPQANNILLNNIEAIQRLKIDRSEFDNSWLKSHDGVPRLQMEQDWADKVKGMSNVPDDIKSSFYSFGDLSQNPSAPKTPTMQMPSWAVQTSTNSQGHTVYWDGKSPYWSDENGKPVK